MPLHVAVGTNCKKGSTTENQGVDVKYMGYGVYVDDCVCVCVLSVLTRLTTLLGGGGILLYYYYYYYRRLDKNLSILKYERYYYLIISIGMGANAYL